MPVFPSGLGVGVPPQDHPDYNAALARLQPDWWYDWGRCSTGEAWPSGQWEPCYIPMMYKRPDERHIAAPFDYSASGRAWLYFNEPCQPGQADITSTQAVRYAWQLWAMGAKRMIVGNIILDQAIPYDDRLGWMTGYVRKGGPLPEAWGVHCYNWSAAGDAPNLAGLRAKLQRFRDWMQALNVVRPIIITEINAQDFPQQNQVELLRAMKTLIGTGEVMAGAWFSAGYRGSRGGEKSDLLSGGRLTELGRIFVE